MLFFISPHVQILPDLSHNLLINMKNHTIHIHFYEIFKNTYWPSSENITPSCIICIWSLTETFLLITRPHKAQCKNIFWLYPYMLSDLHVTDFTRPLTPSSHLPPCISCIWSFIEFLLLITWAHPTQFTPIAYYVSPTDGSSPSF